MEKFLVSYIIITAFSFSLSFAQEIDDWKKGGLYLPIYDLEPTTEESPFFVLGDSFPNNEKGDFLEEIQNNPSDDIRRLRYAQWIESQDKEAEEFIRLQVEIGRSPHPKDFDAKRKRTLELLQNNKNRWFGSLNARLKKSVVDIGKEGTPLMGVTIERGFIFAITMAYRSPLEPADIDKRNPFRNFFDKMGASIRPHVRGVATRVPSLRGGREIMNVYGPIEGVMEHPHWEHIVGINFVGEEEEFLGALTRKKFPDKLASIRDLRIEVYHKDTFQYVTQIMETLFKLKNLKLEKFTLHGMPDAEIAGEKDFIDALLKTPWKLKELELSHLGLSFVTIENLEKKEAGSSLQKGTKAFPDLLALDLSSNNLGDDALKSLARWTGHQIVQLDLSDNPFTSKGVNSLAGSSEWFKELKFLDIHKESYIETRARISRRGKGCDTLCGCIHEVIR